MNVFRRLSTRGLAGLLAAVCAVGAAAAIVAVTAFGGGGATPAPEPLGQAVHDALAAPPVAGVTARIEFTNHLLGSDALGNLGGGGSPLLSGASGRLWLASDGHLRLELQSSSGDAQIVSDGRQLTIYDGTSNTAYELALPQAASAPAQPETPPTVEAISNVLNGLASYVTVSGAIPDSLAGQPAYTVDVSPKDSGGLIGGAELSFDAATGVPLRFAIDARGSSSPVLELDVTDISYGAVADSDVDLAPPAGAKVVTIPIPSGAGGAETHAPPVTGLAAVSQAVPFTLVAPDTLDGLARSDVRLAGTGADAGALVLYGQGLGTIVVAEHAAGGTAPASPLDALPSVSVAGASGHELVTALGSVVAFDHGGVSFTVGGSVTQADAESAAQALVS